jgi:hypothetical protein
MMFASDADEEAVLAAKNEYAAAKIAELREANADAEARIHALTAELSVYANRCTVLVGACACCLPTCSFGTTPSVSCYCLAGVAAFDFTSRLTATRSRSGRGMSACSAVSRFASQLVGVLRPVAVTSNSTARCSHSQHMESTKSAH